jgi:hypothetical protein
MNGKKNTKAFQNVKDQIGFCGIWCGSCVVGNGTLRELTRRYKELINAYSLKEWAPKDFDFDEFFKGLESIQKMPLCAGCLKGGGRDDCEMRACASDKGLQVCTSCQEFGQCKNAGILQHMRTGARDAGLFVIPTNADKQEFVRQWSFELKSKWPCCILFDNDEQ